MEVSNVRNAWMQFLTKLSGGSTAMDGEVSILNDYMDIGGRA